jgi:thioesterase-3
MKPYFYELTIQDKYIDPFGHVNNAAYLQILECARWDLLQKNNFSLQTIQEGGIGPIILEINIKFKQELKSNDTVLIETEIHPFEGKICKIHQRILRDHLLCCEAEFTMAFFDLTLRKIIAPTTELMKLIGLVI